MRPTSGRSPRGVLWLSLGVCLGITVSLLAVPHQALPGAMDFGPAATLTILCLMATSLRDPRSPSLLRA